MSHRLSAPGTVRALLGPTNTGKTHRAVERMLQHRTGMIGLPLRLLAQEVYERIVALKGEAQVALITGEQRRVPLEPRYFVCTVEAMPVQRPVSFLAVDEIQLAGHHNRGHVFTDRLLNARGVIETMFLGSDTIEPLLRQLIPTAEIERHPRFSTLRYTGPKKLSALPQRSALVAFSAEDVYALAERVRRRHGGTAVVLGALSPRARNNQVGLYQSGEVQYMVATDAIGMGLNMDLHHVSFSELRKFDGRTNRALDPTELAQIAGRAGRYQRDGSFGTLMALGALDPDTVEAIEQHRFPPLKKLFWRSSSLDFHSVPALLESLEARPPLPCFIQVRDWEDHEVLRAFTKDAELLGMIHSARATRLAWEVCSVPDFRKDLTDSHALLLAAALRQLLSPRGQLQEDWVETRFRGLDRTDGDIDALMTRMAYVRTWSYIAARDDWMVDAAAWRERCAQTEDKLSDALHQQLTRRFVEGGGRVWVQGLSAPEDSSHAVGRLHGLLYAPNPLAAPLRGPIREAVIGALKERLERALVAPDAEWSLDDRGRLCWEGAPVATLIKGRQTTAPEVKLLRHELLTPPERERLRARAAAWVTARFDALFAALRGPAVERLPPELRGLVYILQSALGTIRARETPLRLDKLSDKNRRLLATLQVRWGRDHLYVTSLLSPDALRLRALLWSLQQPGEGPQGLADDPVLPAVPAALGVERDKALSEDFYAALGYRILGERALRVDEVERLIARVDGLTRSGPAVIPPNVGEALGGGLPALAAAIEGLGFEVRWREGEALRARRR
ncbi:MAG: hypothetical protein IPI35_24900 [Deltaproteobacteria bacterium]|nr:hypothetical protein [Deltaproteobacteria bacterium]